MLLLQKLHIERFRGFKGFEIELEPFSVLIGPNASGKTTILEAVRLLHECLRDWLGAAPRLPGSGLGNISIHAKPVQKVSRGDPAVLHFNKITGERATVTGTFEKAVTLEVRTGSEEGPLQVELLIEGEHPADGSAEHLGVVEQLYRTGAELLPGIGDVSPQEGLTHLSEFQNMIAEGRIAEYWRNWLFWTDNFDKPAFQRVSERVAGLIPGMKIEAPRLDGGNPQPIVIDFRTEAAAEAFDVQFGGGGLRTVVSLLALLEQSPARCLLVDEPDAHLHAELQRAVAEILMREVEEGDRQIIVATHSVDFIEATPPESWIWVDRQKQQAIRKPQLFRISRSLGVPPTRPLLGEDADLYVFAEDQAILDLLGAVAERLGHSWAEEADVMSRPLVTGRGAKGAMELLPRWLAECNFTMPPVVAVFDADWHDLQVLDTGLSVEEREGAVMVTLDRKEIENYLLDAAAITAAAAEFVQRLQAEGRQPRHAAPDEATVRGRIEETVEVHKTQGARVKWHCYQGIRTALREQNPSWDDVRIDQTVEERFEELWSEPEWRIAACPGKQVLRQLLSWLRCEYGINLTSGDIAGALAPVPEALSELSQTIENAYEGGNSGEQ